MALVKEVVCDACGHTDGETGGSTEWLTLRWRRKRRDFCSTGHLTEWLAKQPRQLALEEKAS